jgi:UDP-3-O-[3-hydroxymyristoyl] glucosamine N-acyltransferase
MKLEHLLEAEKEAKRFLSRLKDLKESDLNKTVFTTKEKYLKTTRSSRETGALKRSSLDLTRCLARLRNDTY